MDTRGRQVVQWASRQYSRQPRPLRILEIVVAGVPLFFIFISTVLKLVNPGYDLWQNTISELVLGPLGGIQTAVFYLVAVSILVFTVKAFRKPEMSVLNRIGIVLIGLCAVGFTMLGICPTDPPGIEQTITGAIHLHTTTAIIFLFPVACFLLASGLKLGFRSGWLARFTHGAGVLQLVLVAVLAVLVLEELGWVGMVERMIMVNSMGWLQVVSIIALVT